MRALLLSMKHILIAFSSSHGQTEKIALYMRGKLLERGLGVQTLYIHDAGSSDAIDPQVDAVIIGGPVYIHKFPSVLLGWVRDHKAQFPAGASALYTVSLNAADLRPASRKADAELIQQFKEQTDWTPAVTVSFAGGLAYTRYGFFLKRLMKWISKSNHGPTDTGHDHELTDWKKVDEFIAAFAGGGPKRDVPVGLNDSSLHRV